MTLFKHELKAGCVSLIAWTASISALISVCIFEAKYPVFPGFFSQSVGIMQN